MAQTPPKVQTPPLTGMQRFLRDIARHDRESVRRRLAELPPTTTVGEILPASTSCRRRTFLAGVIQHGRRLVA